jgi:dihydroxyacid dehydratase/phosphogluconate dehydratase
MPAKAIIIAGKPAAKAIMGIASCDKGLPAMMMALASSGDFPAVLVPGGVTLPPSEGGEDAGAVQTIGARFSHGMLSLDEAATLGCKACGSPGGGCQFLGTAATSQVVGEALGLAPFHTALAPSGSEVWFEIATRAAGLIQDLKSNGFGVNQITTSEKNIHRGIHLWTIREHTYQSRHNSVNLLPI